MYLRLFFLALSVVSVLGMSVSNVHADEAVHNNDSGNINFDEVPDKYLVESRAVYKTCQNNHTMKTHYDCKCYALRFLETRLKEGSVMPRSSIEFSLEKECRDFTEVAGHEYNSCLRSYHSLEPGTDPEKYCECYANKYIELMEFYSPTLQSKKLVPLRVEARVQCSRKH